MGRLADFLSEDERRELVEQALSPGQFLRLYCTFTEPPKDKYFVFVCSGSPPILFAVNSRIREYLAKRPSLVKCQIRLSAADYPFLLRDSCLDCSEPSNRFEESEIREQLTDSPARVETRMPPATKDQLLPVIANARTFSGYDKRHITEALDQ